MTSSNLRGSPRSRVATAATLDGDVAELAAQAAVLLGSWDDLAALRPSLRSNASASPISTVLSATGAALSACFAASGSAATAPHHQQQAQHSQFTRLVTSNIHRARRDLCKQMVEGGSEGGVAEIEQLLMMLSVVEEVALGGIGHAPDPYLSPPHSETSSAAQMMHMQQQFGHFPASSPSTIQDDLDSCRSAILVFPGVHARERTLAAVVRGHHSVMLASAGPGGVAGMTADPDKDGTWPRLPAHAKSPLVVAMTLSIAELVVPAAQLQAPWLRCAMQLQDRYPDLAAWALGRVGSPGGNHSVAFGKARLMWAQGRKHDAVAAMKSHVEAHRAPPAPNSDWAAAHLTLNRWVRELNPDWWRSGAPRDEIERFLTTAVDHSCGGAAGMVDAAIWRNWALFHFRVVQYDTCMPGADQLSHLERACTAFVNAICFEERAGHGGIHTVADTLRLLQIWAQLGAAGGNSDMAIGCVDRVPVACWAHVAPQLVAQLSAPARVTRLVVMHALRRAVAYCADAVVFPLWLTAGLNAPAPAAPSSGAAATSPTGGGSAEAAEAARHVLLSAPDHTVVGDSRAFVAGLEDLSMTINERVYHVLCRTLEAIGKEDPGTDADKQAAIEAAVLQTIADARVIIAPLPKYGAQLERFQRLKRFLTRGDATWNWREGRSLAGRIYEDFKSLVDRIARLRLQDFAKALSGRGFNVVAPGEVDPRRPWARCTIAAVDDIVEVIPSKRKPRRVTVRGADGRQLGYLLKAFEDLRVDERVMQLFRLINAALPPQDRAHAVVTYAVVALLPTLGVLGWIPGSQTVIKCIEEHRKAQKIALDLELQRCSEQWPYAQAQQLTRPQRHELFEWTLSECKSIDLARVMWLRSRSSHKWLAMRTDYARSMALNSIAGYVVGLGDRHLGNLMVLESTGRVAHIDFGDCFDRARLRSLFPETVPFRLTRVMVRAMELGGTEGTFRHTAEASLRLLRFMRDSVVGLLSALVYDPTFDAASIAAKRILQQRRRDAAKPALAGATALALPAPMSGFDLQRMPTDGPDASVADDEANPTSPTQAADASTIDAAARDMLVNTIRGKLRGADGVSTGLPFPHRRPNGGRVLSVEAHVRALTKEATDLGNISELFHGWCPLF